MGIRQEHLDLICKWDDPALSTVCDSLTPQDSLSFLKALKKTCGFTSNGVGMAAPQIGILKRAFYLDPLRTGFGIFLLNPEIIAHSEQQEQASEGCLSYPGYEAAVVRWREVTVRFCDEKWKPHVWTYTDFPARVVQHEIDHLNGVCAVGDEWRAVTRRCTDASAIAIAR